MEEMMKNNLILIISAAFSFSVGIGIGAAISDAINNTKKGEKNNGSD